MGIFSRKKVEKVRASELEENRMDMADRSATTSAPQPEPFVSDISMFELEAADWKKFAAILKQNRVLPNSYIKEPAEVKVALGKNNRPMAFVTYISATSTSMREFLFLQDEVFQSINGAIDDGKDKKLNELWKQFQATIRQKNMLNTNIKGRVHRTEAEKMMAIAKKMSRYDRMFDLEQEFLKAHQDAAFDDFTYISSYAARKLNLTPDWMSIPAFIKLEKSAEGNYVENTPVVPFSPKTLEFCISRLTEGCKVENGEYADDFVKMCRIIQEISAYESEDWDKVISKGKDIVEAKFQEEEAKFLEDLESERV